MRALCEQRTLFCVNFSLSLRPFCHCEAPIGAVAIPKEMQYRSAHGIPTPVFGLVRDDTVYFVAAPTVR